MDHNILNSEHYFITFKIRKRDCIFNVKFKYIAYDFPSC